MRSFLLLSLLVLVCLCSIEPTLGAKTKGDKKAKPKDPKAKAKNKRDITIRTPFDKALDKLAACVASSPSLIEVMEENLLEIQKDPKYENLFLHAPHTAAFLKKKKKDSTKFISGLKQSLSADWANPKWRSADEIETIFRPLKQQLVYTMMRFSCK